MSKHNGRFGISDEIAEQWENAIEAKEALAVVVCVRVKEHFSEAVAFFSGNGCDEQAEQYVRDHMKDVSIGDHFDVYRRTWEDEVIIKDADDDSGSCSVQSSP